jgi:UDP-glucose 4-epimerase
VKIGIVGGAGFLGRNLVSLCAEKGNKFQTLVLDVREALEVFECNADAVEIVEFNKIINDLDDDDFDVFLGDCDCLIDFGAVSDLAECELRPDEAFLVNAVKVVSLIKACSKHDIKKFVFASSLYSQNYHSGMYGESKRAAEGLTRYWCNRLNVPWKILRFGSLYGPNAPTSNGIEGFVAEALNAKREGRSPIYRGRADRTRRYLHVYDACQAILKLIDEAAWTQAASIINLTGSNIVTAGYVGTLLNEMLGLGEELHFDNSEGLGHYSNSYVALGDEIASDYSPSFAISLEEGLAAAVKDDK